MRAENEEAETEQEADIGMMTEQEVVNYAMVTAARIEEDIWCKPQVWEDFSEEERLVAASATPTALMAESEI